MNQYDIWVAAFKYFMIQHFLKMDYPNKFWETTLEGELTTWKEQDEWLTTSPKDAADSNISYWEK